MAVAHGGRSPVSHPVQNYVAAVLQTSVVSPPSFAVFDATCRENAQRLVAAIDALMSAPGEPPRVIALPAQPFTGGAATARARWRDQPSVDKVAVDLQGPVLDPLIDVCHRRGCYVAASVFERVAQLPGHRFHTGFIVGPQGLVLRSPKVQSRSAPEVTSLRDIRDEYVDVFGPDAVVPVVATPYGVLGCVVERDIHAPEVGRLLRARGAEVVLNPTANWARRHPGAGPREEAPEEAVRQAVAYTNCCYLLTAKESRAIEEGESLWSAGSSTIVGPDGAVLSRLGPASEGSAFARVDLELIRQSAASRSSLTSPAQAVITELDRLRPNS